MFKTIHFILITGIIAFTSCSKNRLENGTWKGELKVQDKFAPFLFEVSNAETDSATVTLLNGEEKVELTGVTYRGDTLIIPIEAYDAQIKGTVSGGKIEGRFYKNYIENDSGVVFQAEYNNKNRFEKVATPSSYKIDGKWDIAFIDNKGDTAKNVGIFKTQDNIITGSVLTNSGDLRFLEGCYTETGVQLSAFSGLSPYLLAFDFKNENQFEGYFYTTRGITKLIGSKNDKAGLTDPYNIAKLKAGYSTLSFNLPNLEGQKISLKSEKYKNKVVVVSILGSWCPNCLDEADYLAPWYQENKNKGVEIIGLAFERKNDFNYAKGTLSRLKQRKGIDYEILFAGQASPEGISQVLPEIDNFSGYPTTIFIDKSGKVRKIHTGFNGPATGLFYEEFKTEFNKLVDKLLSE